MKAGEAILFVLLLILLGGSLYFLYLNLPGEIVEYTVVDKPKENVPVTFSNSEQFYENMRYPDRIITYSIDSACDSKKREDTIEAFNALQDKTILNFNLVSKGQIEILCTEIAPQPHQRGYFVAGEGGPSEVINGTLYAVILSGKVSFFREENCDNPVIATHEILHALGFDHNNNPQSVLYPTLDCNQKIDASILEDINRLYLMDSLPDLKIDKVEAQKSGPYLSFDIEVLNQGLKIADGVTLTVIANDKSAGEFDLNKIDIGIRKILTVENVRIPKSSNKVTFIVDNNNEIDEISKTNNKIELVLSSS